jgi:hypothetical protein
MKFERRRPTVKVLKQSHIFFVTANRILNTFLPFVSKMLQDKHIDL